jgi:hypothetical protein
MYFIKKNKKKSEMFLHHTYSLPYRKCRQLYITIIECLMFKLLINKKGNIYYAFFPSNHDYYLISM